jgi:predicted glycosyltransferase
MRFLFYSHDGLGLGHTRRHLAVASALAKQVPDAAILVATGAEETGRLGLPRQVEILKLPGLRKDANDTYSSRRLRVSVSEIRSLRSALLVSAVRAFEPRVVLVDKHPFGASGEFKRGLEVLRRAGARTVLGLRDILDEPRQVREEWRKVQPLIAEYYDQVLIYGERGVYDAVKEYSFSAAMAQRTQFCGYVFVPESPLALENFEWPFPTREKRVRPVVLATSGGGEDGSRMLATFMRASVGAAWQGVVVAGPMTPDAESASLERLANECGVAFRHFVPHLSALFGSVDALVCMGGYNTLVEAVALEVPTVCVPRIQPRLEQLMRAKAFEQLGLIQVCHPEELDPPALKAKLTTVLADRAGALPTRVGPQLDLDGARRAANCLVSLARTSDAGRRTRPAVTTPAVSRAY